MSAPPRRQPPVSLRGASAREISRDALLEKVAHERELRSYARRAAAAALFIQKVWRRYYVMKKVAEQLQAEWEVLASQEIICKTSGWISINLIRPFLLFATLSSKFPQKLQSANVQRMSTCFQILLQSINSSEPEKNFCFLAIGTPEEKSTWLYQAQKLVSICLFVLAECDIIHHEVEDMIPLTVLAMRLVVSLTDPKGWKGIKNEKSKDADLAVKKVIDFMSARRCGMYSCIRRYMMNISSRFALQRKTVAVTDDHFLITASAVTLTLRPFHTEMSAEDDTDLVDKKDAYEQYFTLILTIPYLTQCLPPLLLSAFKHVPVLLPCLNHLMTSKDKSFDEIVKLDKSDMSSSYEMAVSHSGWALANVVNLATENIDCGSFVKGLDCRLYVCVINCISENFASWLENVGQLWKKDHYDIQESRDSCSQDGDSDVHNRVKTLFIDLLKPLHQQWHLRRLLAMVKRDFKFQEPDIDAAAQGFECHGNLELLDIVLLYYHMLRIFSLMNPIGGSLPVLNVLSFMPGFLVDLWKALEGSIFHGINCMTFERKPNKVIECENCNEAAGDKKQRRTKDTGYKWVNMLQKITRKSTDVSYADSNADFGSASEVNDNADDLWDVESMRRGPQGISKELTCMLHLFCATYAHLLLVLDDIEFYEKQVPFTLQQQQKITSVLNTFVYNSFIYNSGQTNKPILDVAIRCLHLLYERDCRHKFCPTSLWLGPARKGRIPIAAAARAHEVAFTGMQSRDALAIPSTSSVLRTLPHVYPFEERVQMFREFIKLDKASRRATGEVSGPGPGSIEIVVRRDHLVEDGFRQLNSLGSRLKSCINVSFVSECGLPEAGLDYGGLSKEFLTDLSRDAFNPQYGLFSQTSTSERFLIPNMSARLLENGMEMIEFLGRVVGKALYEGILLDYSFSLVFVQKLLGRYSFLDELSTLDPELYKNLMYLKHFDGDVAELSLDFTVSEELCGKWVVVELKPGGKNVSVTNENKLQYVHAIADYKLNRQILPFANAFYRGLIDLISPAWLSLFNANEFNQLLSGGKHDFDVDDLRSNTRYTGGYSEGSRTIKLFWEVIKEFNPVERCMLLKFVTSCSRGPLLGFKHLQPSFTIHKVPCDVPLWATIGGQDVDRLPSASTCYNTLKLPTYKRSSTLRSKLLYAINSNAGFELS